MIENKNREFYMDSKIILNVVAVFALLLSSNPANAGVAEVKVYRQDLADKVVYHYRVINNSSHTIGTVDIGRHYSAGVTTELVGKPIGWTPQTSTEVSTSSYTAPAGWKAVLINEEESNKTALRFEMIDSTKALKPGEILTDLSISLPERDDSYSSSHFSMNIRGGTPIDGILSQDDVDSIPPTLSVSLSPSLIWPPNNKMVVIKATIAATDDRDSAPVIKLVSITCDDNCDISKDVENAQVGVDDREFSLRAKRSGKFRSGRTYSITYSAFDSAGNSSTETVTVVVPHDHKEHRGDHRNCGDHGHHRHDGKKPSAGHRK
jgi:hypothetical protein